VTPTPTPPSAIVIGTGDQGAILRDEPGGIIVGFVAEGDTIQVIDGPSELRGSLWWFVRTVEGVEGWLIGNLMATLTPTPSITPTGFATSTPTP
jgi:hypothetical protein